MKDLHNVIESRIAIAPQSVADNTPVVSAIIDTQNREALEFLIASGSLADADATFTVQVDHGDAANLSDAAAAPDTDLLGTEADAGFTFAADNSTRKIGYCGAKRYVRITITPAANASAAFVCVLAVLAGARRTPLA
jgi:hypothetical protein